MFQVIQRAGGLSRIRLSRSLPAFSTSPSLFNRDPIGRKEAPKIDNETVLDPKDYTYRRSLETTITVAKRTDLTPILIFKDSNQWHTCESTQRTPRPHLPAFQECHGHQWEMDFNNCQRWENPLMGWTSTADPLSSLKVQFNSPEEAIEHCEKNGWIWYLDVQKIKKEMKQKNYGDIFAWNRRTRVSTK